MKFNFTSNEEKLLCQRHIYYNSDKDYSDDEALELLEQVRDAEVYYSQETDAEGIRLYESYCQLGDKISACI